jgi:hypothetical protein
MLTSHGGKDTDQTKETKTMTIGGHVPCFDLVLVMEALVCLHLVLSYFDYRST